jgi:hypothetical protein
LTYGLSAIKSAGNLNCSLASDVVLLKAMALLTRENKTGIY